MAHGLDWFPFHTEDYLIGTEGLSWEEQGVYVRLIAHMYDRNGPLPDDDRIMARLLLGDIRAWRRVKASLINKGKIKVTSSGIVNERVMKELARRQEKSKKASKAAKERWSVSEQIGDSSGVTIAELPDSYPGATEQLQEDRSENVNKINGAMVETHCDRNAIEKEIENKNNPPTPHGGNEGVQEGLVSTSPAPKPKAKRSRAKAPAEYTDEFEAAWAAFPKGKSQSKPDAFRRWQELDQATRDRLPQAIAVYAAEVKGREEYAKHMASWLNGRFFESIFEKLDAKPAPATTAKPERTDDEWRALIRANITPKWNFQALGPPPSSAHCRVPRHIIREMGLADLYDVTGDPINLHRPDHPVHQTRERSDAAAYH